MLAAYVVVWSFCACSCHCVNCQHKHSYAASQHLPFLKLHGVQASVLCYNCVHAPFILTSAAGIPPCVAAALLLPTHADSGTAQDCLEPFELWPTWPLPTRAWRWRSQATRTTQQPQAPNPGIAATQKPAMRQEQGQAPPPRMEEAPSCSATSTSSCFLWVGCSSPAGGLVQCLV